MKLQTSYSSVAGTATLVGDTIGSYLDGVVKTYRNREAIVIPHQEVRMTYTEYNEAINHVAKALIAAGLKKGERIGIWSPNRLEWALVQFASARVGRHRFRGSGGLHPQPCWSSEGTR